MSGINRTTELIKEFGFSVTFSKLFQTCTRQIPGVQDIAGKIKYATITKFLYKENKDIIFFSSLEKSVCDRNKWTYPYKAMKNRQSIYAQS